MAMFPKRSEPGESIGSMESRREPPPMMSTDPGPPVGPRTSEGAVVGPTVRIQGDISGDEDLLVQGTVEGSISLKSHIVTVGKEGRVNATVDAKVIRIEGTVEGDLRGNEQIVVASAGNVRGNIVAPRVTLEDGCRFKGSIDMEGTGTSSSLGVTSGGASPAGGPGKVDSGKAGSGKAR